MTGRRYLLSEEQRAGGRKSKKSTVVSPERAAFTAVRSRSVDVSKTGSFLHSEDLP